MPGDPYALRDCYGPYLKTSFPDLDYALLGYNVLRGYPLANGHDPGFTLPIFDANYSKPHFTADCRFSLPQGLVIVPDVSCVTDFSSTIVQSKYEFSKSLSVSAQASFAGWGIQFSASTGYRESTSIMSSTESIYIISEARCNYYVSKLDPIKPPPLDPSLIEGVRRLEDDIDNNKTFLEFFDHYGTHFPSAVTFGARFTHQHKMSSETYRKETEKGHNVAVQASYAGKFSAGGGFHTLFINFIGIFVQ